MGTAVWMRVGYVVRGRLADPERPRGGPLARHLVSELVAFDVEEGDPAEHPVAVRAVHGPTGIATTFRRLGEGVMQALVAPGGMDDLTPGLVAEIERTHHPEDDDPWVFHPHSTREVPCPHLKPDRSTLTFREVREDGRVDALAAAHRRMAETRIVGGVLWRASPPPTWRVDVSREIGIARVGLHVPRLDDEEVVDIASHVRNAGGLRYVTAVADVDVRVPSAAVAGAVRAAAPDLEVLDQDYDVEVTAALPDRDGTRAAVVAMAARLDAAMAGATWDMDHETRSALAGLRASAARMDAGRLAPDEALRRCVDAVGDVLSAAETAARRDGRDLARLADAVSGLSLWVALSGLDAECRPTPDEDAVGFGP